MHWKVTSTKQTNRKDIQSKVYAFYTLAQSETHTSRLLLVFVATNGSKSSSVDDSRNKAKKKIINQKMIQV